MKVKGASDWHGQTHLRAFQCDECHGITTATRNPVVCEDDECEGEYVTAPHSIQEQLND